MFCHNCGTKSDGNSKFCENCGTELVSNNSKAKAKSKLKEGAKEVVKQSGSVASTVAAVAAVETAKSGVKTAKKVAIFAAIIAFLIAAANYYFAYMVESPDDVVVKFMEARDSGDTKSLVSCLDPKFQKQFDIGFGLAGGLINSLTGVSLPWGDLFDLSSSFSEELGTAPSEKCHASNFEVTSITGEKLTAFTEKFGTKIKSIGNFLGSKATVEFDVDNVKGCNLTADSASGKKARYSITVRKYGDNWLIPSSELENAKLVGTHN